MLMGRNVRGVSDAGCERIHNRKKMQRAKFYFYVPRRGKGLVQRNAPALRGRGCEFLLD